MAPCGPRPAPKLSPRRSASPLGRRPYDLRYAAVSLWLNLRVPATEVARRAGHGVAVLLKIYAHRRLSLRWFEPSTCHL
jgi:hypothetical protein